MAKTETATLRFNVAIDCDNAAFEDDAISEVIRMLDDLRRQMEHNGRPSPEATGDKYRLADINGNLCGAAWFEHI